MFTLMRSSIKTSVAGIVACSVLFLGISYAGNDRMENRVHPPLILQEWSGNLYHVDQQIFSQWNLTKDFLSAGQMISVNHIVGGDAMVAGAQLIFGPQANVQGDVRAVAWQFASAAKVGGDLMVAAGNITIDAASTVDWLTVLAGGDVVVDGKLNGTVRIFAGNLTFNAQAAGNVLIKAERISFGPDAAIKGDLNYKAKAVNGNPDDVTVWAVTGAMLNMKDRRDGKDDDRDNRGGMSWLQTMCMISIIVFSLLLYLPLRNVWENMQASVLLEKPGKTIIIGLLTYILLPIAAILLMMTVIGLPIGALLLVLYIFMFVLASIVNTCSFLGILHKGLPQKGRQGTLSLLGATIALALLFSNFWWISFLFSIWTYGGITLIKRQLLKGLTLSSWTKNHHSK